KLELLALPLGLAKCGVLVRLNDSARNCTFHLSVNRNVRNRLKSMFTTPGPRMVFRPTVPNRAPVGLANAVVSNHVPSSPTLPSVATEAFTWSGVCALPGMLSAAPDALSVYCRPWYAAKTPLICQSASSARDTPVVAHCLPRPNGTSYR